MTDTAVVAGVGEGFGETVARRLAAEGYAVGLFARSEEYIEELAADIAAAGGEAVAAPTDLSDPDAITAGFERVREAFGPVDVLLYNPSVPAPGHLFEVDDGAFEQVYEVVLRGALHASREAIDDMRDGDGTGTVVFTGTSIAKRAFGNLIAWDVAGPGLYGFAKSLAHRFSPEGVHVAYVVVDGAIAGPGESDAPRDDDELITPEAMADTYLHLIGQDKHAWSFEVDLRAYGDEIRI